MLQPVRNQLPNRREVPRLLRLFPFERNRANRAGKAKANRANKLKVRVAASRVTTGIRKDREVTCKTAATSHHPALKRLLKRRMRALWLRSTCKKSYLPAVRSQRQI